MLASASLGSLLRRRANGHGTLPLMVLPVSCRVPSPAAHWRRPTHATRKERPMPAVTHRFIETNGIRMHLAEQGDGPLVLLCHGWPESWYSWRHQLGALAEAGYHVVAPDM